MKETLSFALIKLSSYIPNFGDLTAGMLILFFCIVGMILLVIGAGSLIVKEGHINNAEKSWILKIGVGCLTLVLFITLTLIIR